MSVVGSPDPAVPQLLRDAHELRERAEVSAAADVYQEVLRRHPGHVDAHIGLAWAREQQRYFADAAEHLAQASLRRPDDADLPWRAGRLHLRNFTAEDALPLLLRARENDSTSPDIGVDIARAWVAIGAPAVALAYLEEALRLRPDDPVIVAHLASAHAELGDFAVAHELFRSVIELDGEVPYALFRLALNGRSSDAAALLEEIETALSNVTADSRDEMLLHQGAYRACVEVGRDEHAYEHLLASKRLVGRTYRGDRQRRLAEDTMRLFTRDFFAERAGWGDHDARPVLVVGMPRSGSTLVESVLAAHPGVTSLGERNYLDVVAHGLWYGNGEPDRFSREVLAVTAEGAGRLAAEYERRSGFLAPRGRLGINKMLHNYRHLGLVPLMFPNARVIHCRRSPLDACWSIFSNPIEHGHPCATSMETLAQQYALSLEYMEHWRSVLPDMVLDVVYEEFIADLPTQAARLLEHVGLPWSDRCLEFDRQERAVQTMSSQQVRRGIYTSSIGRWKRHRDFLAPLVESLVRFGVINAEDADPAP